MEPRRRIKAWVDESRHLRLPAGIHRAGIHGRPEAIEVIDLENPEEIVSVEVDRGQVAR